MASKKHQLNRRTFLKGAGVLAMLPYLEAMGKPLQSLSGIGSMAPKRSCFVYFPNGVGLPPENSPERDWRWFPKETGTNYKFTKTLSPLAPYRDDITILGGLSHPKSRELLGHLAGDTWLTGGDLRGSSYNNSISLDQIIAREFVEDTRYPYLSLSTDGGIGYKSRVSTLSFDSTGKPIPSEHRHREIFERYFAPGGNQASDKRRESLAQEKKIVDLVLEDSKRLQKQLGQPDKVKVDEYLASLNSIEEQIKRNEKWLNVPIKPFDASQLNLNVNPAVDPEAHLKSTFDLMALALELDLTRVITFMMAREDGMGYGDNFPKLALGLTKGHHTISHDKATGHWEEWGRYDQWLTKQFAYFIGKLKNSRDEYGSILDNTVTLYGSACSSTHDAVNYPLVLAGGTNMGLKHGSFHKFEKEVPMSNLLLTLLHTLGIERDQFSDSTEKLHIKTFA